MVVSLHAWVEEDAQPAAQEAPGLPRRATAQRARATSPQPASVAFPQPTRLSEHALANAIDIAGFVTASGRTVDVAHAWGPTARTSGTRRGRPRRKANQGQHRRHRRTRVAPRYGSAPSTGRSAPSHWQASSSQEVIRRGTTPVQTAELQKGAKTSDVSTDRRRYPHRARVPRRVPRAESAEGQFLRRLHLGACGVFGTALGPEANDAHRDHFHFDLAQRRHSALCQ